MTNKGTNSGFNFEKSKDPYRSYRGEVKSNHSYGYRSEFDYGSSYNYPKKASVEDSVKNLVKIGKEVPDLGLLNQLVSNQSPSQSKELSSFIEWIIEYVYRNIPGVEIDIDNTGNLFMIKGKSEYYPCIVAHTDTNQSLHDSVVLMQLNEVLFGWDGLNSCQVGAGFDDKVGILIALQCLKKFDVLKVFLPINEEVGYIGSSRVDMKWFNDVSYCIQPDRNSYKTDFITYTNGVDVCSKEFIEACRPMMNKYNYSEAQGIGTDIGELKSRGLKCSAVNVSCGYFKEHTDQEVCSIVALHNCLNFVTDLITTLGIEHFEHIYKENHYDPYGSKLDYYAHKKNEQNYKDHDDDYEDVWGYYHEDYYGRQNKEPEEYISDYVWDSSNLILTADDLVYLDNEFCPTCQECIHETQVDTYRCYHCHADYWKIDKNGNSNKGDKANKRR
jgi:hypothetical protein